MNTKIHKIKSDLNLTQAEAQMDPNFNLEALIEPGMQFNEIPVKDMAKEFLFYFSKLHIFQMFLLACNIKCLRHNNINRYRMCYSIKICMKIY